LRERCRPKAAGGLELVGLAQGKVILAGFLRSPEESSRLAVFNDLPAPGAHCALQLHANGSTTSGRSAGSAARADNYSKNSTGRHFAEIPRPFSASIRLRKSVVCYP
jgi:hypothetical protein